MYVLQFEFRNMYIKLEHKGSVLGFFNLYLIYAHT